MQSSSIRSFLLLTSFLLFTLAPYSTRLFPTVTIIRLLIGPASSIRLLIGRQLDHFQKSHTKSPYDPRHVLMFALCVHVSVVLTRRTPLLYEARRKRVVLGGVGRRRS